ncbi:hypothetical protein JB92DRAFT_3096525 [Gautieria morchelliformis]|nr:hypothetical protein JB92DRAFT_3096525 [Gautieria morchelliformis]
MPSGSDRGAGPDPGRGYNRSSSFSTPSRSTLSQTSADVEVIILSMGISINMSSTSLALPSPTGVPTKYGIVPLAILDQYSMSMADTVMMSLAFADEAEFVWKRRWSFGQGTSHLCMLYYSPGSIECMMILMPYILQRGTATGVEKSAGVSHAGVEHETLEERGTAYGVETGGWPRRRKQTAAECLSLSSPTLPFLQGSLICRVPDNAWLSGEVPMDAGRFELRWVWCR